MKKIIAFCLLLSVTGATFCQADTTTFSTIKTEYLKKSKNQKTVAWVMVGGGAGLFVAGSIVGVHGWFDFFSGNLNKASNNIGVAGPLAIAGAVSMLGSIPLFISSSHNKHKAMSITFKNDFVPGLQNNIVVKKPVQEVSFVFKF
ncbi:MAG: hypothetical protein ABJB05_01140 [Parafilimonas sp.]